MRYEIDRVTELMAMDGHSFFACDAGIVEIEDLVQAAYEGGRIVRCFGNPHEAIKQFTISTPQIGCIAGWISEDDR